MNDVVWDNPHDVAWDEDDQRARARAMVHAGQNSYFPNMLTASGKALVELAKKGVNLMNINGAADSNDPTQFGSPDDIRNTEIADQPFFDAPGGKFARAVTDMGATAPLGGPVESLITKLGTGPLAKSLAARFLIPPVRSAASGAITAGLTSDPGERIANAEKGAAVGTVLGGTQSVLGRTMEGLVKKSNPLQLLEGDIARSNALPGAVQRDLFVPVSQGYDPNDITSSIVGRFWKSGLPYVPGVEGQLNNQARTAGNTVRSAMLQLSAPEGHIVPGQSSEDVQLSTKQVSDAYREVYNKLRQVNNIKIPPNFDADLKDRIMSADPQIPESAVDRHVATVRGMLDAEAENSKDGMINGWNLKNTRDNVQALNAQTPMPQREGLINTTKDYLDQMFGNKLRQAFNLNNQGTQDILTAYKVNAPNYENFQALRKAVQAARGKSGEFTFGSIAPRANDFTDIQGIDQSAKEVLGQKPAQISQAGRISGYGITGALAALGRYAAMGGTFLGGNLAATKGFQKGLYGDTPLQNALEELAKSNPKLAASLGYAGRNTLTSTIGEDNASNP